MTSSEPGVYSLPHPLAPVAGPAIPGVALLLALVCAVFLPNLARAGAPGPSAELVGLAPGDVEVPFSVEHTDVSAELTAGYASVTVTQSFRNPYGAPLEAVYRFPLPHDAAVDSVAFIVGGKLIQSEIRRVEAAQQEYEAAREAGQRASLTEALRPNLFQQSLANILPGETVYVTFHFAAPLVRDDGEWVLALPSVAGPRYVPQSQGGDAQAQALNPAYVARETPLAHRLSVSAHVRAGAPLLSVHSDTHPFEVQVKGAEAWATLADPDCAPDRAVELRYQTATAEPVLALTAHREAQETGTFAMVLEPPAQIPAGAWAPRELVFVVDTSGSMMGEPIDQVKAALRHAISTLDPRDTFQVVQFADAAQSLFRAPSAATRENIDKGLRFVDALAGSGGTEMMEGIRAALEGAREGGPLRIAMFLTDGYIGNEEDVLSYVQANGGAARLFSFGVGSDVNRYLLDELARVGRGAVQYVLPGSDTQDIVERFYWRIAQPVLTDVTLEWRGLQVDATSPEVLPDVFARVPLRVMGRYTKPGVGELVVRGRGPTGPVELRYPVSLPELEPEHAVLESLWARQRVAEWTALAQYRPSDELRVQIEELALAYRIVTPYTAFVGVERDVVANPTPEALVYALAAVHLPAGVSAEGVFGEVKPQATLSPWSIKPGDPDILVRAPRDASRVLALLPWGEPVECAWDPAQAMWHGRFLVPREAQDGLYRVRVFVVAADGSVDMMSLFYEVDSVAPSFALSLDRAEAARGDSVAVRATADASSAPTAASPRNPDVQVAVRPDLKRIVVRLGELEVELEPGADPTAWEGTLPVPQELTPGLHPVSLVATDLAGNVFETEVQLWVR